ncbi:hypothetical protein [Cytobacillus praedii]|uniref:Uncharacterized protein n=1 Tax=Cytobacillus praedii TaxID=1742358 RepID=A0A4V2NTF5_9BACI|nr:hypothetical protein [Cytobacillus praedii]TCI99999.1 hypothetical protein E0Y62_27025 [Cytobacillus praedii]
MSTHYVNFYPYKEVVKYDNGDLSIVSNYIGDALTHTEFIDELILEGKEYPNECLSIASKIGIYYKEKGSII